MTSWFSEAVVAPAPRARTKAPAAKPKPSPRAKRRSHARGAIVWIVVGALILGGVVFVNLAVLRLNLALDDATQQRSKLRGENAALASQLSSALTSPKIHALSRRQGLVGADLATIGYIDLGR